MSVPVYFGGQGGQLLLKNQGGRTKKIYFWHFVPNFIKKKCLPTSAWNPASTYDEVHPQ